MKKVKKILLGLSIPAAALAMSVGTMVSTPTIAEAGACNEGKKSFCSDVCLGTPVTFCRMMDCGDGLEECNGVKWEWL